MKERSEACLRLCVELCVRRQRVRSVEKVEVAWGMEMWKMEELEAWNFCYLEILANGRRAVSARGELVVPR